MYSMHGIAPCALAVALAASTVAQAQAPAPVKISTRQLAPPVATSTEVLGSLAAVRQLPNGSVLVNDQVRRRVLLLDSTLTLVGVVADSTVNTNSAYGSRPGGLLGYRGDSTLFVDPASLSMLVIDPSGKLTRTMAAPRPNDVNFLTGGPMGSPGFDAKGRLVYAVRDNGMRNFRRPEPGAPFVMPPIPDSSALVRFDLMTRKLDTLAFFRIPKTNVSMSQDDKGGMRVSVTMNPLPVVDDWAVLSDGTVAIVRGQDFHVDLFAADGGKSSAAKIPYEWQRMTDDDKTKFLDSAKVAIEKLRAGLANGTTTPAQAMASAGFGGGFGGGFGDMGGGGGRQMVVVGGPPDGGRGGPPDAARTAPPAGGAPAGITAPPINMVSISELSDYKPVFGQGGVRADLEGHIWVRTIPTKVSAGGAVYEVLDSTGKLVDRVQIPVGTTIAGFGRGGVIYLGMRDDKGIHLQRAK